MHEVLAWAFIHWPHDSHCEVRIVDGVVNKRTSRVSVPKVIDTCDGVGQQYTHAAQQSEEAPQEHRKVQCLLYAAVSSQQSAVSVVAITPGIEVQSELSAVSSRALEQRNTTQHSTGAAQHSTVQYSTVKYSECYGEVELVSTKINHQSHYSVDDSLTHSTKIFT